MRRLFWIVLIMGASGAGTTARADDGGFATLGIGPVLAPMTWDGPGALDGMPLHLDTMRTGVALVGRLVPTISVSPTTRIGFGLGASLSLGGGHMGYTSFSFGGEVEGTVRAAFRVSPEMSIHVGIGPGLASIPPNATLLVGANDNVVGMEMLVGGMADASIGWNRLALEARAGYLRGEHITYVPFMLIGTWRWGSP
jgi:hypothetical protein